MNIIKNPLLNIKTKSEKSVLNLDEVKNYLKIDFSEDDELLSNFIDTAQCQCETFINKSLTERVLVYSLYNYRDTILLPYSPINLIESVIGIGLDGSQEEVENYTLDSVGDILIFNGLKKYYRLDIEYSAGYKTSESIPVDLKQAMLMHIARMYEDRTGYSQLPINSMNIYRKYKQIKI